MKKYVLFVLLPAALMVWNCTPNTENSVQEAAGEVSVENTATVDIKVSGMTCTGCEQSIEKGLKSKEGVETAKASHTKGVATVTYDKSRLSKKELAEAIENKGYTVEEIEQ